MNNFKIETGGIDRLLNALDKFTYVQVKRANRFAINKTLVTVRTEAVKRLRTKVNLPVSVLRDTHTRLRKALTSQPISKMEGVVSFNTRPIPMIQFVTGSKTPINQKGKKVSKRKKLKVKVMPNRKITLPRSFIMRSGAKGYQVFTRQGGRLRLQRTRSIGLIVRDQGLGDYLQLVAGRRYQTLFYSYLKSGFSGKGLD